MRSWQMAVLATIILIIGFALGCEGFFVDPVLTGITVGPATTIQTGTTLQMTAVGSYNDGSQKKLSSKVYWSSATLKVATVDGNGVVTGGRTWPKHDYPSVRDGHRKGHNDGNRRELGLHPSDISGRLRQHRVWQQRTVCCNRHRQRTAA